MDAASFDPGPLGAAQAEPDGDRWTLVFVRELAHPVEKVWAALTEPGQLERWAPYTADRDLAGLGDVQITMLPGDAASGDSTVDIPATVRRAEEPTLLEYTWGPDVLRWELARSGSGTRLTLRHTVQDKDSVAKVAAGWHLCLVVAEHLLDGQPIEPIRGEDARRYGWEDLQQAYRKELDL